MSCLDDTLVELSPMRRRLSRYSGLRAIRMTGQPAGHITADQSRYQHRRSPLQWYRQICRDDGRHARPGAVVTRLSRSPSVDRLMVRWYSELVARRHEGYVGGPDL